MKRRQLYILVFIVSILGLFVVQIQFLRIGLNLAKVQFDKKVSEAGLHIKADLADRNQLTFLIEQALNRDSTYFTLSADSIADASRHFLNDFIKHRLTEEGIEADYSYRLFTRDSTYYLTSPQTFKANSEIITYPFEIEGYLKKNLDKQILLELQFRDLNNYFFFQLNGLTIPSLIFIIAIIAVVIWVLRSFYWQRSVITTTNEFINNLTHELKTPVFSIGLASKMLNEKVTEEDKPLVATIREQSERLKIHIDKVLELGSLESQKKFFNLKKIDFKPHLEALCQSFQSIAKLENIPFRYVLEGDDYYIVAETIHLENAINNLLDNARKYGDNGQITLSASKTEKTFKIEVKDSGQGIAEKEKNKIFKKYYRVSQGDIHKTKGYGLGLTYVREVVKKHKGTITFESELGKGSTVTLKIPLVNAN